MANSLNRPKVDKSLQYRWGIIGLVLVVAFAVWYARTSGESRSFLQQSDSTRNLVKIICPRCNNEEPRKKECSLCGGLGSIWVDKTREDIPAEVIMP